MFPKTMGGLIAFVIMAVVSTIIGLWIVNRMPFLQMIVAPRRVE